MGDGYVRYCCAMENARMYEKRIVEKILEKREVSIIFVDNRNNGQSYHYFGRRQD